MAASNPSDKPKPPLKFANRTRFLMLVLITLCLSIVLSNALTLNFTVICMADPMPDIQLYNQSGSIFADENGTFYEVGLNTSSLDAYQEAVANRKFAYTQSEKSQLFSAVAIGAMISVYPSMFLIQKFGTRPVVAFFGFSSAFVTALIPLMANLGLWWLTIFRALQGVSLGMQFSLIGISTSNWSMQKQNAFFIAFLTAFFQIGPIFTMPVAGALCTSSLGWTSVYYLHSVITVALFVLFVVFYREFPDDHAFVSQKEIDRIKRDKCGKANRTFSGQLMTKARSLVNRLLAAADNSGKREPLPLRAMLTTHAVYAVWVSAIANFMGIQVTMQFSPIYLNKVLGFPVGMTGIFSCVPQVVTFIVKMIAGVLSDKITFCSPLVSVKVFNTISIGGMGIFFFALAWTPSTAPILGIILLIICTSIVGFNCGAFFKASQLMARQHNHFIMGVNSFLNCLSTLLAPVFVGLFVKEDKPEEWWSVWFTYGVVLTVCNIYFCIFGKSDAAEWTKTALSGGDRVYPGSVPDLDQDPENPKEPSRIRFSSKSSIKHVENVNESNVEKYDQVSMNSADGKHRKDALAETYPESASASKNHQNGHFRVTNPDNATTFETNTKAGTPARPARRIQRPVLVPRTNCAHHKSTDLAPCSSQDKHHDLNLDKHTVESVSPISDAKDTVHTPILDRSSSTRSSTEEGNYYKIAFEEGEENEINKDDIDNSERHTTPSDCVSAEEPGKPISTETSGRPATLPGGRPARNHGDEKAQNSDSKPMTSSSHETPIMPPLVSKSAQKHYRSATENGQSESRTTHVEYVEEDPLTPHSSSNRVCTKTDSGFVDVVRPHHDHIGVDHSEDSAAWMQARPYGRNSDPGPSSATSSETSVDDGCPEPEDVPPLELRPPLQLAVPAGGTRSSNRSITRFY